VINRVLIRPILKKTPYELFNGRKPNISHLKVFGCRCFILNNGKENLGKFDEKADNGIFIGYSSTSHAYRVYNKRLMIVEESVHVVFDEIIHTDQGSTKDYAEEDEQNIIMQKLESCTKNNRLILRNNRLKLCNRKSCQRSGEFQGRHHWPDPEGCFYM